MPCDDQFSEFMTTVGQKGGRGVQFAVNEIPLIGTEQNNYQI